MFLHDICLSALNHEITQALACGKRLERTFLLDQLASFGLLHFFVVSGAHLNMVIFILSKFKALERRPWLVQFTLLIFVGMCNFSPPILRIFICNFLKNSLGSFHIFTPIFVSHLLSYLICLFIFRHSDVLIFSASLSYTFSLLLFFSRTRRTSLTNFKLYIISIPFFLFVFGVPHFSTLVITPLTAFVLGAFLLPASLLSLLYHRAELFVIRVWWLFQDFINHTSIFFNFPKKIYWENNFVSSENLILFNFMNVLFISTGVILWRRRSYSFS